MPYKTKSFLSLLIIMIIITHTIMTWMLLECDTFIWKSTDSQALSS